MKRRIRRIGVALANLERKEVQHHALYHEGLSQIALEREHLEAELAEANRIGDAFTVLAGLVGKG